METSQNVRWMCFRMDACEIFTGIFIEMEGPSGSYENYLAAFLWS